MLTDNEIVKALECCMGDSGMGDCKNCPNFKDFCDCEENLAKCALDLINRKDARIAELEAENERYLHSIKLLEKDVAQAKSEAYREFGDKLHDNFISKVQKRYCLISSEHPYKYTEGYTADDVLSTIVTTLKELTEKNDFKE